MYGYDVDSVEDPCIQAADESIFTSSKLFLPGGSLVNLFPFIRYIPAWVPGATSKKIAEKSKALTTESRRVPMDSLRSRMVRIAFDAESIYSRMITEMVVYRQANGPVPPSLVSTFLESKNSSFSSERDEENFQNVAYAVYGGT